MQSPKSHNPVLIMMQDLTLPKSMIARLAKGVLPANTQIQKDALLAMHKSATVFVSYIASKYAHLYHVLLCSPCSALLPRMRALLGDHSSYSIPANIKQL
jgi:hypothetical protein